MFSSIRYSNKRWTFIDSVAEGLKSLKVREKELEILRANEESRQSRFSLRKAPLECNSQHEANAMVLAKWAADEQHFMALPLGQSDDGNNFGGDQNATSANNKGGLVLFPCLACKYKSKLNFILISLGAEFR